MKRLILFFILLGTWTILTQPNASAQQQLFFSTSSNNLETLNSIKEKIINNLQQKAIGGKVNLLDFNKIALNESHILVQLENQEVEFILDELDIRNHEDFSWHGHQKKGQGTMVLVYMKGQLAGSIIHNNRNYTISPFGEGTVSLYEVNPITYPKDHPQSYDENTSTREMLNSVSTSAEDVILRVLVAYTPAAESGAAGIGYSDIKLFLQEAISETNQSFINSNVSHRVKLAAGIEVNYTESSTFETDLNRFESTTDGNMDEVHTYRNNYSADVCILIIDNSTACGLASDIGSTASTAFGVVHYDCTLGNYSFGHEIAHLHGCRHDPQVDPDTTPYAYGHGYIRPSEWRTIMAYNTYCSCPRIQYWSNPNVTYNGVAMGTASTSDNARVLNETASTLANYRTAASNLTLTSSASLDNGEIGDAIATSSITLSPGFTVVSGAEFYANAASSTAGSRIAQNTTTKKILGEELQEDGQNSSDNLQIYPNPNPGIFDIKFHNDDSDKIEITILDVNGTLIYRSINPSEGEIKVNLASRASGIYLVRLSDGSKKIITKRIIVK